MTTKVTAKKLKKPLDLPLGKAAPQKEIDLSHVRLPINTSVFGLKQVLTLFETATSEVKAYLAYECDLMYECRVCRTIFRSLANFILHKRKYCRDKYSFTEDRYKGCGEADGVSIIQKDIESANRIISEENGVDEKIYPKRQLNPIIERLLQKHENKKFVESKKSENLSNEPTNSEKRLKNFDTIALEKIKTSDVAVFQTAALRSNLANTEFMKSEVMEIHSILDDGEAVIGSDGKILRSNNLKNLDKTLLKNTLSCTECDLKFSTKKTLTHHVKYRHNDTRLVYPCPECKETLSNPYGVYRHLLRVHRKTSNQIRRYRTQVHNNAVCKKVQSIQPKTKKETKETKEVREDNDEENEWLDNVEGDNDLQMCGGCGKRFERKAALISHAVMCTKRIAICNSIKENNAKKKEADYRENKFKAKSPKMNKPQIVGSARRKPKNLITYKSKSDESVENCAVRNKNNKPGKNIDRIPQPISETTKIVSPVPDPVTTFPSNVKTRSQGNVDIGKSREETVECSKPSPNSEYEENVQTKIACSKTVYPLSTSEINIFKRNQKEFNDEDRISAKESDMKDSDEVHLGNREFPKETMIPSSMEDSKQMDQEYGEPLQESVIIPEKIIDTKESNQTDLGNEGPSKESMIPLEPIIHMNDSNPVDIEPPKENVIPLKKSVDKECSNQIDLGNEEPSKENLIPPEQSVNIEDSKQINLGNEETFEENVILHGKSIHSEDPNQTHTGNEEPSEENMAPVDIKYSNVFELGNEEPPKEEVILLKQIIKMEDSNQAHLENQKLPKEKCISLDENINMKDSKEINIENEECKEKIRTILQGQRIEWKDQNQIELGNEGPSKENTKPLEQSINQMDLGEEDSSEEHMISNKQSTIHPTKDNEIINSRSPSIVSEDDYNFNFSDSNDSPCKGFDREESIGLSNYRNFFKFRSIEELTETENIPYEVNIEISNSKTSLDIDPQMNAECSRIEEILDEKSDTENQNGENKIEESLRFETSESSSSTIELESTISLNNNNSQITSIHDDLEFSESELQNFQHVSVKSLIKEIIEEEPFFAIAEEVDVHIISGDGAICSEASTSMSETLNDDMSESERDIPSEIIYEDNILGITSDNVKNLSDDHVNLRNKTKRKRSFSFHDELEAKKMFQVQTDFDEGFTDNENDTFILRITPYTDMTNFLCCLCKSGFSSLSHLLMHMSIHFSWFRYQCSKCSFMSYNKHDCENHAHKEHQLPFCKMQNIVMPIPTWKSALISDNLNSLEPLTNIGTSTASVLVNSLEHLKVKAEIKSNHLHNESNESEIPHAHSTKSDFIDLTNDNEEQEISKNMDTKIPEGASLEIGTNKNGDIPASANTNSQSSGMTKQAILEIIIGDDGKKKKKLENGSSSDHVRIPRNRTKSIKTSQKDFIYDLNIVKSKTIKGSSSVLPKHLNFSDNKETQ